jgi:hypothetical protein
VLHGVSRNVTKYMYYVDTCAKRFHILYIFYRFVLSEILYCVIPSVLIKLMACFKFEISLLSSVAVCTVGNEANNDKYY